MSISDDITIIFINYYQDNLILKNIKNLESFKIIIFDNNFNSNLNKKIKNKINIKYIKNNKNIGEGRAANIALSYVRTNYTLYLNPDTIMKKKEVINLYKKFFTYKDIGIIAPIHYDDNKKFFFSFKPRYFDDYKIKRDKKDFIIKKKIDKTIPTGDLSSRNIWGAPIFFETKFMKKINFFDETFFLYFEDTDLCDRVYKVKKKIIVTTDSYCVHSKIGNDKHKNNYKNLFIHTISFINSQLYYFKKNNKNTFYLFLRIFEYFVNFIKYLFVFNIEKSLKNLFRIFGLLIYFLKLKL